jgi:hypothetical protein
VLRKKKQNKKHCKSTPAKQAAGNVTIVCIQFLFINKVDIKGV